MADDVLMLPPDADPVLDYARPDVEQLVYQVVKPLGGVVSWAYTAAERDLRGWLTSVNVQVDIRSHNKTNALRRADLARRAVCALPWVDWPDGVVARVDVLEGPFWLPDENGGPRYVARYGLIVHPVPASEESEVAR